MKIEVNSNEVKIDGVIYRKDGQGTPQHEVIVFGETYKPVVTVPVGETMVVNTDVLNFRSEPDLSGSVIGTFARSQRLEAFETTTADGWYWRKIINNGRAGYCAQKTTNGSTKLMLTLSEWEALQAGGGGGTTPTSNYITTHSSGKKIFTFDGKNSLMWQCINARRLAYSFSDNQIHDLGKFCQAHKIPVIRFYASHMEYLPVDCGNRVRHVLDILQQYKIRGHVCLNDSLSISGMTYKADKTYNEYYRNAPDGHCNYLWYVERAWRRYYQPQINGILSIVGNHPNVFAFGMMNEWSVGYQQGTTRPITITDANNAKLFAAENAQYIRQRTKHMINADIISGAHVTVGDSYSEVLGFYNAFNPNFVDCHIYGQKTYNSTQNWGMDESRFYTDLSVANTKKIPMVVGEIGSWFNGGSRRQILTNATHRFHGASINSFWWGNEDYYSMSPNLSDYNDLVAMLDQLQAEYDY